MKYYLLVLASVISRFAICQSVELVYNINPIESSNPRFLCSFNNNLYFAASDDRSCSKLWKYSGLDKPVMIDTNKSFIYNPREIYSFNEKLVLSSGENCSTSGQLIEYDDINNSATIINGITGRYPINLVKFKDLLLFYIPVGDSYYLWKYDFNNPPSQVFDVPIKNGHNIWMVHDGFYYFIDTDSRIWKYNGADEPQLEIGHEFSIYGDLTIFKNKLYFLGYAPASGTQIYEYDWINAPTVPFYTSSVYNLVVIENKLLYAVGYVSGGVFVGRGLWEYDGINDRKELMDLTLGGFLYNEFIFYNQKLYFSADDRIHGFELWEYNGIDQPKLVADINPGKKGSSPHSFCEHNNNLYFAADDGIHGTELWRFSLSNMAFFKQENSYKIFPNPTNGTIVIELKSQFEGVRIYNSLGYEVFSSKEKIIHLDELQKGIYFAELMTDQGRFIEKIIYY